MTMQCSKGRRWSFQKIVLGQLDIHMGKKCLLASTSLYTQESIPDVSVRLGCYNKSTINFGVWWGPASSFMDGVLLLWPHIAKRIGISLEPKHLPMPHLLIPLPWGLRFQHMSLGQNTGIQTIARWTGEINWKIKQ